MIRAPLQYRIRGERLWHPGMSRNISGSGILFEGDAPLGPGTQFEVRLTLKSTVGTNTESSIRFHGTIVYSPREGVWAARIFSRRLQRAEANASSAFH